MKRFLLVAGDWLESRTGLRTAASRFLFESIPATTSWPQVFGSIALFLFLTQVVTGVLLALNYAPAPSEAYSSLLYILNNVAAGKMVHGLHHWGSSLMVIVVFLHMAQVFIYGAYRKPREATWMAGVFLLLLVLAFGLTGYLLPWDNRAYWGTVVTTEIMSSVPVAGPFLSHLAGSSNGVGSVTFARFYAIHTVLLPASTIFLIAVHLYLVRRHGVAAETGNTESEPQVFYPNQVFRDVVAIFVAFLLLFAAAAFLNVPLERKADPTDSAYIPRPEWYFLFLFELLKLFSGRLEFVGSVLLPSLAVLALLALPFLRRMHVTILARRTHAALAVMLIFCVWAVLTARAAWTNPHRQSVAFVPHQAAVWSQYAPEIIAGWGYFGVAGCASCHNLFFGSPKQGPTLGLRSPQRPKEWLTEHLRTARSELPEAKRPRLTPPRLNALLRFVTNLQPESLSVFKDMSPEFVAGAQAYSENGCSTCHKVNGVGGEVGPGLNGLANRHDETWVEKHFASPAALTPGSVMPPYQFKSEEEKALVLYLFSLPD